MGNNVLSAIANISNFRTNDLRAYSSRYLIRINAVGDQLEYYVKDALAGSFSMQQAKKEAVYSSVFSYLGNQNNPPDVILKGGDAFEIKKIESPKNSIALNSSPPKDNLHFSDPMLTDACRRCEGNKWQEKDLFYIVGHAKKGTLKYLFIVHGKCYAAEKSVYNKIHGSLKGEITKTIKASGLEMGETVELGRVNKSDPLGITELRIRGMWQIRNPIEVFSYVYTYNSAKEFSLVTLMTKDKYDSYPEQDIQAIEKNKSIAVSDVKIKDPNNPAKRINAKLIVCGW